MPEKKNRFYPIIILLLLAIAVLLSLLILLLSKHTCRSTAPEIEFNLSDPSTTTSVVISSEISAQEHISSSSSQKTSQPKTSSAKPSSSGNQTSSLVSSSAPPSSEPSSTAADSNNQSPSKTSDEPSSSATVSSKPTSSANDSSQESSSTVSSQPIPSLPPFPSNPPSTPVSSLPVSSATSATIPSSSTPSVSSSAPSSTSSSVSSLVSSSASSSISSVPAVEIVEEYSHRDALTSREQILYDILYDAFLQCAHIVTAGSYSNEEIFATYRAIYLDHPELFFLEHDLPPDCFLSDQQNGTTFFFDYPNNTATLQSQKSNLLARARTITALTNGMSTKLEKAQFLHEYVTSGQTATLEAYFCDHARERTLLLLFEQIGISARTDFGMNQNELYRYTLSVTINGTVYTFDPEP